MAYQEEETRSTGAFQEGSMAAETRDSRSGNGDGNSNTGFDDGDGNYVDNKYIGKHTVGPNVDNTLEPYFEDFNRRVDELIKGGIDEDTAIDRAYDDLWNDIESSEVANVERTQQIKKAVATLATALGMPLVGAAALISGVLDNAKKNNPDLDDIEVLGRFYEEMELNPDVINDNEAMADIFGYNDGEEFGRVINSITNGDTSDFGAVTDGSLTNYDPTGPDPFTHPDSPYQDLIEAIGGPATGDKLPPAYEQYREDLLGARITELQNILPEVFAETKERGLGAVGGISSVYQDLKLGTERRIGEQVRIAQKETSAQALDAYTKGRAVEGQLGIEAVGTPADLQKARVAGQSAENIAEAGYEADKYKALISGGLDLYDILTG